MKKNLTSLVIGTIITVSLFHSESVYCQMTRSISGMVINDIKTPEGTVRVTMPDDIRGGETISGMVTALPEGKNDKDKKKNLEKLLKLTLMASGTAYVLGDIIKENTGNGFHYTCPVQPSGLAGKTTELNLLDKGKNIGTYTVPVTAGGFVDPGIPGPGIQLQSPLIEKDQPYLVVRSPFKDLNNYEFQVKDNHGQVQTLTPVCGARGEAVLKLPPGTPTGSGSITAKPKGSNALAESISMNFTQVQADYQVMKDNLQRGETTLLKGRISGLDSRIHQNPTLLLENLTSGTIQLGKGNSQSIYVNPLSMEGNRNGGEFSFERMITGVKPGPFNINATLNIHPKDYSDPFQLQMRSLRTKEEFNNWQDALKHDLNEYARSQPATRSGNANKQNAQTILQNMMPANSESEMELMKVQVDNMLRSIAADPKKLNNWDCSYVSQETALNPLKENIQQHNSKPVDWEMLNQFAENIQNRAEMAGYNKAIGPLVNKVLMQTAVSQAKDANSRGYRSLIQEVFIALTSAAAALPDDRKPTYNRPDPVNDLVGYLDPAKRTLWAVDKELPGIINKLGAVKDNNGLYTFNGVNMKGNTVPCSFNVVPSTLPQLHTLFKVLADIILNGAAAANQNKDSTGKKKDSTDANPTTTEKKKDSTKPFIPGYRIKQDTDLVSGTIYRFYKNAQCVSFNSSDSQSPEDCIPETRQRFTHKPTGESEKDYIDRMVKETNSGKQFGYDPFETESFETGRYLKYSSKPVFKCAKGAETCTEVLISCITVSVYDDVNCSQLLETYVPAYSRKFSCAGK